MNTYNCVCQFCGKEALMTERRVRWRSFFTFPEGWVFERNGEKICPDCFKLVETGKL